jgi:hypothetical protein
MITVDTACVASILFLDILANPIGGMKNGEMPQFLLINTKALTDEREKDRC